ncbi:MAG: tyrosine--tRNA ligase [Candidatus Paceibacterota bacterium]|jgi:tyrosyl-tRNA synthetase
MKINTDPKKIEEILNRSVQNILPSKDFFRKELLSGRKLKIYVGADATGTKLHIGHATNFMIIERLRQLGHEVIILFGDFTAMIGDPSGKDSARKALTKNDVSQNLKNWKSQVSKVVKIGGVDNGAKIVTNSTWLSKMSFADVVKLASNFTVQQMLERDMFQKRLEEKKPIFLQEFLYPLMQGYDSVALDVDVEVGGNDQTFNMLVGRTLQKNTRNKEKFVVATTLLINPKTGRKLMSKSEGSVIGLDDEYHDMFGKCMSLPDEAIISVFTDCTYVSMEEISEIKKQLENGANPRDAKLRLGKEIVKIYYNQEKADSAEKDFIETFKKGGLPENMEEIKTENGKSLMELLVEKKIVSSKTDFRRLISENAVSNAVNSEKITDVNFKIHNEITLKIGKKRFVKITI